MKVVIVGTMSAGKGTLCEALNKILKLPFSKIPFNNAKNSLFPGKDYSQFSKDDAIALVMEVFKIRRNFEVKNNSFLSEGGSIYDLSYILLLASQFGVDINQVEEIATYFINHAKQTYDKIYYLPIEFPIRFKGNPFESEENRRKIDQLILEIMDKNNIKYEVLKGSLDDRLKIILENFKISV